MGKVRVSAHCKTKSGNVFKTDEIANVAKMLPLESNQKVTDTK